MSINELSGFPKMSLMQRPVHQCIMNEIGKDPNIKELAIKCYEGRYSNGNSTPLVLYAMHFESFFLVKKFREIDKESRDFPLNNLIMNVAVKGIKSTEIRGYLFSEATKKELSEILLYSGNAGKIAHQKTILHVAIEKNDQDLISRLMKKEVDLDVRDETGKTSIELANLKGKPLEVAGRQPNLFADSPLNVKFSFK
ncbi:MAG: hypothetical protein KR126chlam5_00028 [Candidatus Anoxychlamydiales bacterium]|nr:hypothetical protein [Candidatus Anoxychlamydiales bacterium]